MQTAAFEDKISGDASEQEKGCGDLAGLWNCSGSSGEKVEGVCIGEGDDLESRKGKASKPTASAIGGSGVDVEK